MCGGGGITSSAPFFCSAIAISVIFCIMKPTSSTLFSMYYEWMRRIFEYCSTIKGVVGRGKISKLVELIISYEYWLNNSVVNVHTCTRGLTSHSPLLLLFCITLYIFSHVKCRVLFFRWMYLLLNDVILNPHQLRI